MRNKFLGTGEPGYHPIKKIRVVAAGLRFAVIHDFSVAYKLAMSLVLLGACFWLREWMDILLVLVATTMVLVAELFNSAIEALCDFIEEKHDPRIGAIKDVAAAAVGLSIVCWVSVMLVETTQLIRLWKA